MFRKPLQELTPSDIQGLIDRGVQESFDVEFKKTLSGRDGAPDPWVLGQDKIGNIAKTDLIKELVAFSNTSGGTLVLGIEEDGEKRAADVVPLRDCRSLADRLAASIVATTDPPLTFLEHAGVECSDRAGVVVFRVPQSHRAPHRCKTTLECYVRTGDRSEPMTMRQVQDLSIERAQGLQKVARMLQERSERFRITQPTEFDLIEGYARVTRTVCGFRAAAYPMETVFVENIADRREYHLPTASLRLTREDGPGHIFSEQEWGRWDPILRGIRALDQEPSEHEVTERVFRADGLIEVTARTAERYRDPRAGLIGVPTKYLVRTFAQLLIDVEAFRRICGRPELEFALDFEWRLPNGARLLLPQKDYDSPRVAAPVEPFNRVTDYEMPSREKLPQFFERLMADVWSSFGLNLKGEFPIDFEAGVKSVLGRH